MRYLFIVLAIAGIVVSSLALHEHYRVEGQAPCSINDKWDCGIVNKSEYAVFWKVPVAAIGIAGYVLLGALGAARRYKLLAAASMVALGFSLYLTWIEARILGVYCIYCVISLGIICVFTLLSLIAASVSGMRRGLPS
jgi:vitamin-K-epoxide reductase (warfarin-sensitive)